MAVTDFFLEGTITAGTTTTIQPASGTIYSFKRGRVSCNASATYAALFTLQYGNHAWPAGYGMNVAGSVNVAEYFSLYSFSETGVSFRGYADAAIYSGTAGSQSHPFAVISNTSTISFYAGNSILNGRYTLVGVSMT